MNRIQIITTPTGPISVVFPLAKVLLNEGVISGALDEVLKAGDAATVKAAIMAHAICDFCSAPGATQGFAIPDFDMPYGVGESTGGWAACETCAELVKANKRQALLDRSVANLAFPKFSKKAIAELQNRFWKGLDGMTEALTAAKGIGAFIEDQLPEVQSKLTDRDKRVEAIARMAKLTRAEVEDVAACWAKPDQVVEPAVALKLLKFKKDYGKLDPAMLADLYEPSKKPLPVKVPHWQAALDAKFEAAANIRSFLKDTAHDQWFPDAIDLKDPAAVKKVVQLAEARTHLAQLGYDTDLKFLPRAQAYSFNAETEAAIREASQSIPHDAPLSSIDTPTGTGWFWFSDPLPIASSPIASDSTHALLWGWLEGTSVGWSKPPLDVGSTLMFSAYVKDDKNPKSAITGKVLPSTRWFWPVAMTFDEMLAFNAESWQRTYGPGSRLEHDPHVISKDATMKVAAELSLFFVMACVWFRQTVPGEPKKKINPILTQETGHVERHARKRYQREFKLPDTPTVKVVALRKTARVEMVDFPTERKEGAREYHCRWIVKGHPRMQACGPGRKDRKLIWIEPHPAGPEGKPLRTKTTVFAVIR